LRKSVYRLVAVIEGILDAGSDFEIRAHLPGTIATGDEIILRVDGSEGRRMHNLSVGHDSENEPKITFS